MSESTVPLEEMTNITENPESIEVSCPAGANIISLTSALKPTSRSALLILNQPIVIPRFKALWDNFQLKICGDGGANQLFKLFTTDEERKLYLPHYIIGDLDSLENDVRSWYESHGVEVIPQTTQYATDLNKCLDAVEVYYNLKDLNQEFVVKEIDHYDGLIKLHSNIKSHNAIQCVLLGAIDGRFDHTIQSISLLFNLSKTNPNLRLYYLSPTDLIFMIPKGVNHLEYENLSAIHGSNCGLLPLGGPVKLTTHGFKWDVANWESSIKGSVSSSNRLVGVNGATIESDDDLILNIQVNHQELNL